ncbi:uncharacterized protein BP5553_02412 [Venustampulla echinocandica]|uniref:Uncharacterized protein n=1 Tax=Venustampulla echinocandica TaxID=2656787 RepID=A0A370U3W3_9HELO|nr:uncharacterized protein BP5553_02412 [Venustampulla echinocandica]RDL42433.1 hypothetical protein BP5553_02412 [Venustampulla echinocandica]
MFRYTSRRMGIFSTSRLPLRLEAKRQQAQVVNIQKVRFIKPRLRVRATSFFIYAITIYACINVFDKLVLDPLDRAAEEALKNTPAAELAEDTDKPLFIPFPGTTKVVKALPYQGSDPEWQTFIKINRDRPLQARLRAELADLIRQLGESHPLIALKCGKGLKPNRSWINIDYPNYPPPGYERSGIEISDEAVSWVTAPVDSHTVFRLQKILWPQALMRSCWDFAKVLVADDTKWFAGILGIQSNNSPVPSLGELVTRNEHPLKHPALNKTGPPLTTEPAKSTVDGKIAEDEYFASAEQTKLAALRQHFLKPIAAFKTKFKQTWSPARNYPPRGCIILKGLVELEGPKAYVLFDVSAAWDPKTKTFHKDSYDIKVKRLSAKKQGPLSR